MLSVQQDSIKYHFLSLWYDLTWDWAQISRAIGKHSNHYANVRTLASLYAVLSSPKILLVSSGRVYPTFCLTLIRALAAFVALLQLPYCLAAAKALPNYIRDDLLNKHIRILHHLNSCRPNLLCLPWEFIYLTFVFDGLNQSLKFRWFLFKNRHSQPSRSSDIYLIHSVYESITTTTKKPKKNNNKNNQNMPARPWQTKIRLYKI